MTHICDHRCLREEGHHSWPSPGKNECLCGQKVRENYVWCPFHNTVWTPECVGKLEQNKIIPALSTVRNVVVSLRLSKEEKSLLDRVCSSWNISHSEFFRRKLKAEGNKYSLEHAPKG